MSLTAVPDTTAKAWWARIPLVYWAFGVYFILAVLHCKERMLNSDCSLQLFRSVNDRAFFFQEGRYGMFITQLPMLVGVYLRLPMMAILVLYSEGLAATYGCCIFLAQRVFRSPVGALAIMLSLVVGVGDSFFHATTETHLLLALSGLLFAALEWLSAGHRNARGYGVVVLITVWCLFTHPNAQFTIGFVVGLLLLAGRIRIHESLGILGLCAVFFAVRLLMMREGSYDDRQFDELKGYATHLSRFWELFPIWFIRQYLENEYVAVVLILLLLVLFYRPIPRLMFTMAAALFFWTLSVLTFHMGGVEAMMEKAFMPGIFMVCLPFAWLCYHHAGSRIFRGAALLLFCHSLINIELHRRYYGDRLDAMSDLIIKHGSAAPKILLRQEDFEGTVLHFSEWAMSIDALMLSRCSGDSARTIFLDKGQQECVAALGDPRIFLYLPWDPLGAPSLDRYYFNLPSTPYRVVRAEFPPRNGRFH